MTKLREALTNAIELAEKMMAHSILKFTLVKESFPDNGRLVFLSAQLLEMAYLCEFMAKASRGLAVYITEDDLEGAKSDLFEAFQAIDNLHTNTPNDRSRIARDFLLEGLEAIEGNDIEKSLDILGSISAIAETSKDSVIEHLEAIKIEQSLCEKQMPLH